MSDGLLLQVTDVSLRMQDVDILEHISFSVKKGEYIALIGPNGSGKTSLLKVLLGLYRPSSGKVVLHTPMLGYVPQKLDIDKSIPISVEEFLKVYHPDFGKHAEDFEVLSSLDAMKLLKRPLGVLSGGEMQKILIANAVLRHPPLLLLDEPTAGIDAIGEKYFYEYMQKYIETHNASVILVSHDMHMVYQYASQVLCLKVSMQCQGTPDEVTSCTTFQDIFGTSTTHFHHHHS